ncbi:MAG: tetratricopeptide repeat protein [Candidatus Cloacimonetes bacterium]|nr:tetratricopeptide repeat protein [Candidatus Cloacimonadota bacterium]
MKKIFYTKTLERLLKEFSEEEANSIISELEIDDSKIEEEIVDILNLFRSNYENESGKSDTLKLITIFFDRIIKSGAYLPAKQIQELGCKLGLDSELSFLSNSGFLFYNLADYEKTMNYCIKLDNLAQKIGDYKRRAEAIRFLGFTCRVMNNYTEALSHFQQLAELAENMKDYHNQVSALNEISNIYIFMGISSEAKDYKYKALKIANENNINDIYILHDLGFLYLSLNQFEEALSFFKEVKVREDKLSIREKAILGISISEAYSALNELDLSEEVLNESFLMLENTDFLAEKMMVCQKFVEINLKKNDYKQAFEFLTKEKEYREEIFGNEKLKVTHELQKKYEIEKRIAEAEIHRLKNIELANINKKLHEVIDIFESTQKQLLEMEKKNSILAVAVTANHEINQPLMIIKGNLEMLVSCCEKNGYNEKAKKYIGTINKSVNRIAEILEKFRNFRSVSYEEYTDDTEMAIFDTDED